MPLYSNKQKALVTIKVKYLVSYKQRGRTYFSWKPGKHLRLEGYKTEGLGTDRYKATQRAIELNSMVENDHIKKIETEKNVRMGYSFIPGSLYHLSCIFQGSEEDRITPSVEWLGLRPGTQEHYVRYMKRLCEKFGDVQVSKFDPEFVYTLHRSMRDTPSAADYLLSTFSAMFHIAIINTSKFGVKENPCKDITRFGSNRREELWLPGFVDKFTKYTIKNDWEVYVAFCLLFYTGQRLGDCLGMKNIDFKDGEVFVEQEKSRTKKKKKLNIPCHEDLLVVLEKHKEVRRKQGRIGGTVVQTVSGKQFIKRNFQRRWDTAFKKAKLEGLTRHDVRRTAVTNLANAGCTNAEIAAITGHSSASIDRIIQYYLVRTTKQAKSAIAKLEIATRKDSEPKK